MKKGLGLLMPLFLMACSQQATISKDTLKDKIAGGWAGKMIGVSYGLPTEFKALGKMYEDSIHWAPVRVKDALWEDDLYVQLTLMDVMDKHGMQAEQKKYQEALATAGFRLWHANVQTRKNYFDSIFPPQSGQPEFNLHADDIDFQIEADYIGFMCPGMPQTANKMADYMGHIMNYGDGVYGGAFVASLYSEAYLQNDIRSVIEKALLSLPAESGYRRIIEDVIAFHQENPDDWTKCWQMLEDKWARANICNPGTKYNIDAKLNGAYIVIGLLYGEGDINKTLEISTRCGQDSDCNPASAAGILATIQGYSQIPEYWMKNLREVENLNFAYTDMSLNQTYQTSFKHALQMIKRNGGSISGDNITIVCQTPVPVRFEQAFEGMFPIGRQEIRKELRHLGSFTFEGTGIVFTGYIRGAKNYVAQVEMYVDGKIIERAVLPTGKNHRVDLFWKYQLPEGKHIVHSNG